ncbi:MAG: SpoIIE family protein phosphatase [Clostridia bacterium]|nr:SpoIIE family protein phosphatase [Clostridia bacterium]
MEDKKTVLQKTTDRVRQSVHTVKEFCRVMLGKDLLGEEERLLSRRRRRTLLFFLLYATVSALFSLTALPYGAHPLGYAFFAAAPSHYALFSLFGLLLSLFWQTDAVVAAFVLSLGVLMRVLIKRAGTERRYFEETRKLRLALAASLAFLEGFALSALAGFSQASLIALAVTTLSAPVFALLFSLITSPTKDGAWREIGRLSIVFFLVYALDTVGLFGFSFGAMLAFFLTLSIAITGGALRGVLMGVVTGLALGGMYAPIFAVAGLCTGLCANLNLTYSVLASTLLSVVMNLYLNGVNTAIGFSGDVVFTALIFLPLAKAKLIPEIQFFADEPGELPDMKYVEGVQKKFRQNKLNALSSAFEELSDVFLKLSEKSRRPGSYEIKEAGDEVFSRYCEGCALHSICWQRDESETSEAVNALFRKVQKGERATCCDLPDSFGKRCRHLEKILRDINNAAADLVERAIRRDKTELFALDYEAMAELLAETAREGDDEFARDLALYKKASHALRGAGIVALGYSAWGKRQKTVLASGVEIASLSVNGKEIARLLSEATELAFAEPHFDFNGDFVTMTVTTLPRIRQEFATAGRAKEEGNVSGDATAAFTDARGTPFFLLCDGMGSGKAAAITARISTVFMETMMSAGNSKEVVLKMLSNFLRSKSEECHSTCDLVEIDAYSSRAIFLKCGAAPSYLYHAEHLITVDLSSLPIGITREFSPAIEELPLSPGDILILSSDGLVFSTDALSALLAEHQADTPKTLADTLLSTFATDDDATVTVIRIT